SALDECQILIHRSVVFRSNIDDGFCRAGDHIGPVWLEAHHPDCGSKMPPALVRLGKSSIAQSDKQAGHGYPGVFAHGHWHSASMASFAFKPDPHPGDAGDTADNAERNVLSFKDGSLLNMDLDKGSDILAKGRAKLG